MGLQVTASKTALLLECSRPFAPDTSVIHEPPTEPMRYGSALHECLEACGNAPRGGGTVDFFAIAAKWGPGIDAAELVRHTADTMACLKKWLAGDNTLNEPFKVVSRETHRATYLRRTVYMSKKFAGYQPVSRSCDFEADSHTYDLRPGEFGGTDDLVAVSSTGRRVVIDYKSGDFGDFHTPSRIPQMLTLALQTNATAVGILHTPREGVPVMYVDPVSPGELQAHARSLRKAMRRIGDGSLRPGNHCGRCPARESCPAKDGELLQRAGALVQLVAKSEVMSKPVNKGQFHMFLQEFDRLQKRAREVLREEVRSGDIIVRPDGKVLVIRTKEVRNLSMASIVRALGKVEGERMIAKLTEKGCVEVRTQEELHAVDDK